MKIKNQICWKITNKCNFNCIYHERSFHKKESDTASHLLDFIRNSEEKWQICITGGEPFLYPHFVEICREITASNHIILDTNLSVTPLVKKFAQIINPKKTISIVVSLHIEEREKNDTVSDFIECVNLLQKKNFPIKVVYVLYPTLIPRFERDYQYFKERNVTLVPKPFKGIYTGKLYPQAYTFSENQIFSEYASAGVGKKITYNFRGNRCLTGSRFFLLAPNGDIRRCSSDKRVIGNVENSSIENILFDSVIPCDVDLCTCYGVDYTQLDKARTIFMKGIHFFFKNEIETASLFFYESLKNDSSLSAALNNLGVIAFNQGDLQRACEFFTSAHSLRQTKELYKRNLSFCESLILGRATRSINPKICTDLSVSV